ncbi:hypothetical protein [Streptomyces sp. NPDC058664]|uniref:hypothetical protein n=1 Tax=unclassified Streptomyces TaxID=2593676 RepID=UPI00364F7641
MRGDGGGRAARLRAGQVASPAYGQGQLAKVLAEEGRHAEAAEICGRYGGSGQPEVSFWSTVEWSAELDAAGRRDEALGAFTVLVDDTRRTAEAATSSLAVLVWELVHRSRMFDAAGRREEAGADRQEALLPLVRLAETGEPKVWGNVLSRWSTLFALSGRAAEPAGSREAPAPPFGADPLHWSPDTRKSYFAAAPALEAEVARPVEAGRLSEAPAAHQRPARRAALLEGKRTYRIEERLRPVFDEGVALARRLPASSEALAHALTDRAMFLVAVQRYGEAHADFGEAVGILGGATPQPIVTLA